MAKLSRSDRKQIEAILARYKTNDRTMMSAQDSIPFLRMYPDGICRVTDNRLSWKNYLNRHRKHHLTLKNRNPKAQSCDMSNRKRNIRIRFRVTPEERALIEEKMTQVGTSNMEAYLRKMAIDGYILKLDLPELKEMISLLRRCSNNLNQIAKRTNQTGRLYGEDMGDILQNQERLWQAANEILGKLSAL